MYQYKCKIHYVLLYEKLYCYFAWKLQGRLSLIKNSAKFKFEQLTSTRKFLFHSRSSNAEMTCMNAWLLARVQPIRRRTELIKSRSIARALTTALNSASCSVQKAAFRLLLANMLLLLLLVHILHCCLSHIIDKSPKQRKRAIVAVSALVIACSASVCVYIIDPHYDIINHSNATAHVNVTGSTQVEPGSQFRVKGE